MWILLLALLQGNQTAADLAGKAYAELREGQYQAAVQGFRRSLALNGQQRHVRKDLAYTLLRLGDREGARDEFEKVFREDPSDGHAGLEYAFLCYETKRVQAARRTFRGLRNSQDARVRETASRAFDSVDRPLQEGMARWSEAVRLAPRQWSAHEELARLAEDADETALAAEHYEHAWRLRPAQDSLLLDLARVWLASGETGKARQALARAWRSGPPRVAEIAREMMNGSVPAESDPALAPPPQAAGEILSAPPLPAREMGERSLAGSYLRDAYNYFKQAHEEDPADDEVVYKLGITSNLLGEDRDALKWFAKARKSPEPSIARAAGTAYETLAPSFQRFSVNAWSIPFYSSRWNGTFLYGQVKAEWKPARIPLIPYLSLRLVGDTSGRRNGMPVGLSFLSENSVIGAAGLRARLDSASFAWFEAGQSYSYVDNHFGHSALRPDYRGGISSLRGCGRLLGSSEAGAFHETGVDGVYASRFDHDLLIYLQNRTGYTLARTASGWQAQAYAAWNVTADVKGQYWGNFAEAGAGIRVITPGLPRGMSLRAEFLRGVHLKNSSNPWGPNYWDFRTGLWYAFIH